MDNKQAVREEMDLLDPKTLTFRLEVNGQTLL